MLKSVKLFLMRKGPVILLVVLSLILFFILGVRYGQRVEKTNKEIAQLLKITPAQKPSPTKPVSYLTYANSTCDLEFVYPSNYKILKEQNESASFSINNKDAAFAFSCEETNPFEILETEKVATEEVQFQNKPLQVKSTQKNGQKYLFFSLRNPVNSKTVYFIAEEPLYPLIEASLEFKNITAQE